MKKIFGPGCLLLILVLPGLTRVSTTPRCEISNGLIKARLWLPDKVNGYYRGVRFDWSSVISSLTFKEHSYFSKWFEEYDPTLHDAITGPVEEFTPLDYDELQPGQTFIKIGVGALLKPGHGKYKFSQNYSMMNSGDWSVKKKKDEVKFRHVLNDSSGYSYDYAKTVRLTAEKPELVLEHILKNTGRKTIETSVYNHNFFVIDDEPSAPSIQIKFPFAVAANGRGWGTLARVDSNRIIYIRKLSKGESVYSAGLEGFGKSPEHYDIKIENLKTGAGVRIRSDSSLEKLVFWSSSTTYCPEPYIKLSIEPGQAVTWKIFYEFYTFPPLKTGK